MSSSAIRSASISLTLVLETEAPLSAWYPVVKKNLNSNTPCGVFMYLLAIARLTVVSCTPTMSAICVIVSGCRCATPCSKNAVCALMISRVIRSIVRWRCSIESIRNLPDRIRSRR